MLMACNPYWPPIGFGQLNPGNFGDGVRFVRLFQWTGKQGVLAHRLGRVLRINAGRTEKRQLVDTPTVRRIDDVILNLQILIDEVRAIGVIGIDAAHFRSGQKYKFGPLALEKSAHRGLVQQIQFTADTKNQVLEALALQLPYNRGAH